MHWYCLLRDEDQVFIPNKYPSDQLSVGSCNGDFELDEIINNTSKSLKEFTGNFHIYTFGGLKETNKWLKENGYV